MKINPSNYTPVLLLSYFKITLRKIKRQTGYSFINIAGLAVGMACCIIMLLWVQNEKSFDRFHANRDSIFRMIKETRANNKTILDARTPFPLAEAISGRIPEVVNYTRYQGVEGWRMRYEDKVFFNDYLSTADSSFFEIFTFPFVKGDPETALSDRKSIVVSESMASKYFGDEEPMGKVITIGQEGNVFTVTGVIKDVPKNSHLKFDCIIPVVNFWEWWDGRQDGWNMIMFYTYIQLAPNSSSELVGPKIAAILNENVEGTEAKIRLQSLNDVHLRSNIEWDLDNWAKGSQSTLTIFTLAAIGVLVLAMINFANLSTARSASRAKEVGLRKASGAWQMDIMGQFLGEAVVLALISLVMALVLVYFAIPYFNALSGKQIDFKALFNLKVILSLIGISFITGILSGGYPSFFLSSFRPAAVLKGEITSGGKSHSVLYKSLVVAQFTLTLFLVIGSAIVNKQMTFIKEKNLGIDTHNVVKLEVVLRDFQAVKNTFLSNPNVLSITRSDPPQLDQRGISDVNWEGKTLDDNIQFFPLTVDPDYLQTFKGEMAEGRFFSYDIPTDISQAVVLNETAVKAMGLTSPIGKKVSIQSQPYTVIGIIRDFHQSSLHKPIEPMIIRYPQWHYSVCARISPVNTKETIAFFETTLKKFSPDRPFRYEFIDDRIDGFYNSERKVEAILSVFTIIALFTACMGLFGLVSFLVRKRTREIGIRKVFGAPVTGLVWLLAWDFSKWILLSGLIASPVAYFATRKWLDGFAYHVKPTAGIFFITILATLLIALIAVGFQSVRAANANPVNSLHHE